MGDTQGVGVFPIFSIMLQTPELRYPDVCSDEIGKYNGGPVKLHIDNNVRPVAQRNRKTAFNLMIPCSQVYFAKD
jgi:hypothetical protein